MTLDFTEKLRMGSRAILPDMFKTYTDEALGSTFTYRTLGLSRPLDSWRLTDFFASAAQAGPAVQVGGPAVRVGPESSAEPPERSLPNKESSSARRLRHYCWRSLPSPWAILSDNFVFSLQDYPFEGNAIPREKKPPPIREVPASADDATIKEPESDGQQLNETDGAALLGGSRFCGEGQRGAVGSRTSASGGGSLAVAVGCVVILSIMKMLCQSS
jgi:hypothetical protein